MRDLTAGLEVERPVDPSGEAWIEEVFRFAASRIAGRAAGPSMPSDRQTLRAAFGSSGEPIRREMPQKRTCMVASIGN